MGRKSTKENKIYIRQVVRSLVIPERKPLKSWDLFLRIALKKLKVRKPYRIPKKYWLWLTVTKLHPYATISVPMNVRLDRSMCRR